MGARPASGVCLELAPKAGRGSLRRTRTMSEPTLATLRASRPLLVRRLLWMTVFGVAVFAALSLYGDVSSLAANFRTYRWSTFAVAVAAASGNYVLRYLRWEFYLRRIGQRLPATDSILIFLSGFALSVTPGKIGELFKSALLHELNRAPLSRTAPIVIAERITDVTALVVLASVGSLALNLGPAVISSGGMLVAFILLVCLVPRVGFAVIGALKRLPLVHRMTDTLEASYRSLLSLTGGLSLLWMTLLATLAWFLEVLSLQVIIEGLDAELDLVAATFTYALATIAGALAMMPGGLGVTEAGMTALLLSFEGTGITPSIATAATILTRLATLWWAVLVGFAALAIFRATAPRISPHSPESG